MALQMSGMVEGMVRYLLLSATNFLFDVCSR